jgi:hypothetical protein
MSKPGIAPVRQGLIFLWVWTIGWCSISFPMAWQIWAQQPAQWGARAFISLFVVIGVTALYFVIRMQRKQVLSRNMRLMQPSTRPRAGQVFTAELQFSASPQRIQSLQGTQLQLQLVQYEEDRSGSGVSLIRSHAMSQTVQPQQLPDGHWHLQAQFDMPSNAPATGAVRHGNRVLWRVELHTQTQGELASFPIEMRAAEPPPLAWKTEPSESTSAITSTNRSTAAPLSASAAWPEVDEGEQRLDGREIAPLDVGEQATSIPIDAARLDDDSPAWRARFPRKAWRGFAILLTVASVYVLFQAKGLWHASSSLGALAEGLVGWLLACALLAASLHAWTKRWHLVVQDAGFAIDKSSALFTKVRELGAAQAQPLRLELIYTTSNAQSGRVWYFSVAMPGTGSAEKIRITPALPTARVATALAHHFWQALSHRRMRFAAEGQPPTTPGPVFATRLASWLSLVVLSSLYFAIAAQSPKLRWADLLQPHVIVDQVSTQLLRLQPSQWIRAYQHDALLKGFRQGQVERVASALASGADPNAVNDEGLPLLIEAAGLGQTEMVQMLLKHGANVNLRHTADPNKHGDTALLVAFYKGHLQTAQLLLAAGADLRAKNRWDWGALHMAAQGDCIACLQWLVAQGFSPNESAPASRGETPVMLAAGRNKLASLQWLAANGGDLLQKDPYGYNALGWAEFFKRHETAQWLRTPSLTTDLLK